MKRLVIATILASLLLPAVAAPHAAATRQTETLTYDVYYHWGIIWKKAGIGVLSLTDETAADGSHRMHGRLAARSLSIVESLMKVRDTLDCWYTPEMIPLEYCKKTNEGSYHATERNRYTSFYGLGNVATPSTVDSTHVAVFRWRQKKGSDQRRHTTDGVAYDMLSIFYVIRALDFDAMQRGATLRYPIFSGIKPANVMNVHYLGREQVELRSGKKYAAHRLELSFKSKDSDSTPLYVYLSTESDHRPLKVTISLKRIGEIQGQIAE